MSNRRVSPRALLALLIVPLSTAIACASGRAHDTDPAPAPREGDTPPNANSDGLSIENLFEGRFPGVSLTRMEGGGIQIRIRGGSNTFYGSNEPLYVLDDTPLPAGSGGIMFINPYDIQKIEVLKNPADIGIYGMRGTNGVIRITTRQARRR